MFLKIRCPKQSFNERVFAPLVMYVSVCMQALYEQVCSSIDQCFQLQMVKCSCRSTGSPKCIKQLCVKCCNDQACPKHGKKRTRTIIKIGTQSQPQLQPQQPQSSSCKCGSDSTKYCFFGRCDLCCKDLVCIPHSRNSLTQPDQVTLQPSEEVVQATGISLESSSRSSRLVSRFSSPQDVVSIDVEQPTCSSTKRMRNNQVATEVCNNVEALVITDQYRIPASCKYTLAEQMMVVGEDMECKIFVHYCVL